jgi:hypothetical protein
MKRRVSGPRSLPLAEWPIADRATWERAQSGLKASTAAVLAAAESTVSSSVTTPLYLLTDFVFFRSAITILVFIDLYQWAGEFWALTKKK